MKSGVKTTFDGLNKFRKSLAALESKQVMVGIPEDKAARKDDAVISNAAIGYLMQNGSPAQNIPARPHLPEGVEDKKAEIAALLKVGASQVFDKGPGALDKAYTKAGIVAVNAVKQRIVNQTDFAPLAESTIAARQRKGFKGSKALIRTGQFLNSFTFVVRNKKGKAR